MMPLKNDRDGRLRRAAVFVLLLVVFGLLAPVALAQEEEQTKVHALLFFLPTCGHCEYVIYEVLFPEVFPENGGDPVVVGSQADSEGLIPFYLVTNGSLEMVFVDASTSEGGQFFIDASRAIGVPDEALGHVPLLIVQDMWYMGSGDIPDYFPGIVADGLAGNGIPWPDVPGIDSVLASVSAGDDGTATTTVPNNDGAIPVTGESMWELFGDDQPANSIALVVLVLLVISLVAVDILFRRRGDGTRFDVLVPILALVGLGIAIYLAYIESSGVEAVCGPVGNCNAVQQSKYAKLFGVIPIGIIGIAGYAASLVAWLTARVSRRSAADWARVALFAGAVGGTLFSVYLTYLEPFVIGATCAWCVGSAVIVTLLMLLTAGPAGEAWERLHPAPSQPAADDRDRRGSVDRAGKGSRPAQRSRSQRR